MDFKQGAQNDKKIISLLIIGVVVIIGGVIAAVSFLRPDNSQVRSSSPVNQTDQTNEVGSSQPIVINKDSTVVAVNNDNNTLKVKSVKKIIDQDGDGVDDEVEKQIGTDPNNIDSDYDDLPDGEEIYAWKTNPLTKDTDKDKLFDYWEVKRYFTDPLNPDTDGDGYLDGEEVLNGYNPNGPGKM